MRNSKLGMMSSFPKYPVWIAVALTASCYVQAANVLLIAIEKGGLSRSLVGNREFLGLKSRSTALETLYNNVSIGAYTANVTIGTPGQLITLILDTGSSDIWVLSHTADACINPALTKEHGTCSGGTFDPSQSPSFVDIITGGFNISYTNGVEAKGDYIKDTFAFAGVTVNGVQMGLAYNSTSPWGVMGIGYPSNEAASQQYPNLPDLLVSQGLIGATAYSLYLNEQNSTTGSILFGGIDTEKFSGTLGVLNVQNSSSTPRGQTFLVNMTSMSIADGTGNVTSLTSSSVLVILDSGISLSYIPSDTLNAIITYFGAIDETNQSGYILIDCGKLTTDAGTYFTFRFGNAVGSAPTINVPISEMIFPVPEGSPTGSPFQSTCFLGLNSGTQNTYILGDTFLRSAYVVYDIANNQIGLAQSSFRVTTSNIVELKAGLSSIPVLSGIPIISGGTATSKTATGTQSPSTSTSSQGSSGSSSSSPEVHAPGHHLSGGAIAGIVISSLIILAALGILAFLCLRRRRATHRESTEPGRGSELPTNANTQELQTQFNKHELVGSEEYPIEAPSATYSPSSLGNAGFASLHEITLGQLEMASNPVLRELPAGPLKRKPIAPQGPVSGSSVTSTSNVMQPGASLEEDPSTAAETSSGPSKLDILQQRIERVRAEKERLAKERELEGMETALQQEIMTELRKQHGLGSG